VPISARPSFDRPPAHIEALHQGLNALAGQRLGLAGQVGVAVGGEDGVVTSSVRLKVEPNQIGSKVVNGPGGKRVIDFFIKIGERVATIEAKYKIPASGSAAFQRLVAQLQSAMATPATGQVTLWTFKAPAEAELTIVWNATV